MSKCLYNHSLSLTFLALFIVCIVGQAIAGRQAYNSTLGEHGRPSIAMAEYLRTGNFLDGVFSNWQAAILQLACLITFGTVLHQKGAPHSRKPEGDSKEKVDQKGHGRSWIYCHSLSLAFIALFAMTMLAHCVFSN